MKKKSKTARSSTRKKQAPRKKEEEIIRPKGMRDLRNDSFYRFQGFFEHAAEVAVSYGFKPIETPILEKEAIFKKSVGEHTDIVEKEMYRLKTKGGDALVLRPEGTAPVVRAYIEHGMHTEPQPVMLYYYGPFFRHEKPQRGRWREFYQFGLEILGTDKTIADALIIKLTHLILSEAGFKELCARVNSIGCEACRTSYVKTLAAYYRKHANALPAKDRERLKTNPLRILDSKEEKTRELNKEAPEAVASLCDKCRVHFSGVLEYLDELEIPYHIDHTLVRGLDYYTRTVFEVVNGWVPEMNGDNNEEKNAESEDGKKQEERDEREEKPGKPSPVSLAGGGRYDDLAKVLGSKRDIAAVGVSFGVDRIVESPEFAPHTPRVLKKPKVYFIQLGADAKLKSLSVIETLRKARIPLVHALSKDTLSAQIGTAERLNIPYSIIMGQRESVEGSVIVRDMQTRSQKTVPVQDIIDYLRKRGK